MLKSKTGIAAIAALAIAQAATGAMARTPALGSSDEVQIVVRYGDLNLATPEGAHALKARVDRAAVRVKGDVDPRNLQAVAEMRKARAAAQEAADAIIAAHQGSAYAATRPAPNKIGL
ncbi:MAG TPA: UrcA family protein [Caulobacteraceae bacterium]|nr:UrcA family protein [Caulobacteraceae bacterium]